MGFFRRRPAPPPLDLRRPGVTFEDVTDHEAIARAIAQGRLERFWLIGPQFGGVDEPFNTSVGPPGAAAAKAWIDQQIEAAIAKGQQVKGGAQIEYDDGPSRVARSVTFDLGLGEPLTLRFW